MTPTIEKTDNAVVLGNRAKLILNDSKSVLELSKLSEKLLNNFRHIDEDSILEKYSFYKKRIVHYKNDSIRIDSKITVPKKKTTILKKEN